MKTGSPQRGQRKAAVEMRAGSKQHEPAVERERGQEKGWDESVADCLLCKG